MNWINRHAIFFFIGIVTAHGWEIAEWERWVFLVVLCLLVTLRDISIKGIE